LLQFYQNVYPRRPETQQQTNVAPWCNDWFR
jgi:hypothetical protein